MSKSKMIILPKDVSELIATLRSRGFESFAVGGCIRDSILGREPNDWDITTNATVDEISLAFKDKCSIIPTGIKHGTLTLLINQITYEVTTYRIDGEYSDHRRPDEVIFTKNLKDDLSRRDFTINALAYNETEGLVDYFGGLEDIDNKIIRCVCEPEQRFKEDALRIVRCVRFASQLGFSIEPKTQTAMKNLVDTLDYVAYERIQAELNKAIVGDGFREVFTENIEVLCKIVPELVPTIGFNQHSKYHKFTVFDHIMHAVESSPKDLVIRLAMLLHDAGKPLCFKIDERGFGHFIGHDTVSAEIARGFFTRLKYSSAIKNRAIKLIEMHNIDIAPNKEFLKKLLNRSDEETIWQLLEVMIADNEAKVDEFRDIKIVELEKAKKLLRQIIDEKDCFKINQLEISGDDLISIGLPQGREIGTILNRLFDMVINKEVLNEREELLSNARAIYQTEFAHLIE